MNDRNRTILDSGVQLSGDFPVVAPITGTGVTPAQAIALAAPIINFLASIPYELDEFGMIAYRTNTLAMNHLPELTYAANHPLAGQLILADLSGGDYATRHGGAPMPFIDMDMLSGHSLQVFLRLMYAQRDAILNAT